MTKPILFRAALFTLGACAALHASPSLLTTGTFSGNSDLSGLSGTLENGAAANLLGGIGSGLTWAGGDTFIFLPDRGPNAVTWNTNLDNTTSWIPRFDTVNLQLTAGNGGSFTATPTLASTTLLWNATPLNYAPANAANNQIAGAPSINTASQYYFSGRSDNFSGSGSGNPANARLDPEGIRLSPDGQSVFISDEYGPYIYQFSRTTGERLHTFTLPSVFTIQNLSAIGQTEIDGNTIGRVANKGMEGLAITPDGKTLVGFMQSPLIQDGGDGGKANRIVTVDILTGVTHQYVYNNFLSDTNKAYNSSELLAINDHEFLVLERDGKGLGDGSSAVVKRLYKIDLAGATDIGTLNLSGEASLLPYAVNKTLFLDLKSALNASGLSNTQIPAKLEGASFGPDVVVNGVTKHTLYIANDNDFVAGASGPNNVYIFTFDDGDLGTSASGLPTAFTPVPEPATGSLALIALGAAGFARWRRRL